MPENGGIGVGEVHILAANPCRERLDDLMEDEYGVHTRDMLLIRLWKVLELLKTTGMRAKLRIYLDGKRRFVKKDISPGDLEGGLEGMYELEHRSVYIGTLDVRGMQIYLGNAELGADNLKDWYEACSVEFRGATGITPERAGELARVIVAHARDVERKSLETLRRTLGAEVTDQLIGKGEIRVRSANGMEYMIKGSGEVFRLRSGSRPKQVCVRVEGEEKLPEYDRVLAKYLVIRDHPEQIETLDERLPERMSRRDLVRERIDCLQQEMEMLEQRQREERERRA